MNHAISIDPLAHAYPMDSVSKMSQFDHSPMQIAVNTPRSTRPRPSNPRVSIVVPIGNDLAAFENTLISVLESCPRDAEIVVAHDGSYEDPFELCDEVTFAVSSSGHFVDLLQAGTRAAKARLIHVLTPGLTVSYGWTDAALEKFEHHDCGSVACVIRDPHTQRIVSAGWHKTSNTVASDVCGGERVLDPSSTRLVGAHLAASFWRRDLLLQLAEGFEATKNRLEASVAYGYLSRQAGWRCVVAPESELHVEQPALINEVHCFNTRQRLAGLQMHFSSNPSVLRTLMGAAVQLTNPAKWSTALGRIAGAFSAQSLADRIHEDAVVRPAAADHVIPFPIREQDFAAQRAA